MNGDISDIIAISSHVTAKGVSVTVIYQLLIGKVGEFACYLINLHCAVVVGNFCLSHSMYLALDLLGVLYPSLSVYIISQLGQFVNSFGKIIFVILHKVFSRKTLELYILHKNRARGSYARGREDYPLQ